MILTVQKTSVGWSVIGSKGHEQAIFAVADSREAAQDECDHLSRCLRVLGVTE